MSHEKSITLRIGPKKFANFKSVFNRNQAAGKQRTTSDRQVKKMFDEGRVKPLGGKTFPSMKSAVDAAKARSRATPKKRDPGRILKRKK